jgi:hypothetical protein
MNIHLFFEFSRPQLLSLALAIQQPVRGSGDPP